MLSGDKGLQMKIQRGNSPCKTSPAAECRSEPGPQDGAGCPGFQSWHLWSQSAHLWSSWHSLPSFHWCWHPKQDHSQILLVPSILLTLNFRGVSISQRALTTAQCAADFTRMPGADYIWLRFTNTWVAEEWWKQELWNLNLWAPISWVTVITSGLRSPL